MTNPKTNYEGDELIAHMAHYKQNYTDAERLSDMMADMRGFLIATRAGKHAYRFDIKEAIRMTREMEEKLYKVRCSKCGKKL